MLKYIAIFLGLSSFAFANCEGLFEQRHLGKAEAEAALDCFKIGATSNRSEEALNLTRQAYLKFFIAEFFLEQKTATLLDGIDLAERAVLLFGTKYALTEYRTLAPAELKQLAESLYVYGLCISRYIDLMGTMEALKRMGDIKKSMATIMRLKEDAVAHFGAHRTMGIFHTKVPAIAGGDFKLAGELLKTAVAETSAKDGLSSYPANNVAYADWLHQANRKPEACAQLGLVTVLTRTEVENLHNGLLLETLADVAKAKDLARARCSR